ncbi:hypothetical protein G9A89_013966 [Geosiphon pyriformis]|nr:hypothetical protein G9A89_013966 [Geosiphon pyriformis]
MNELTINTFESTRKKKKAKVDFIIDPKKVSISTVDNNKPLKTKVFKNPPKLEPPEIVQKSGPYSVVKDLMETPAHITFGQLITHPQFRKDLHKLLIPKKKTPKTNKCPCQARLADNSNVTPLICKAQVAGYFIDLILDSRSSISIIVKHFLEAIDRKINKLFTRPITNIHSNKKKDLGIAKAIPVRINGISIETNMEVSKAKKYTIIVVPKQNQEKQSNESDNDESNNEKDQEKSEKTAELTYTIFTSNGKPLDNVKADKKEIIHGSCAWCWCNKSLYSPSDECKFCLIYYKDWKPISLIPRKELKEVQKFFENKPPKIQSLIVEQRELSPGERKVNIENLLARNSPVISKESDIPGQTHVIQHTITTKETCSIYLKPYQSNQHNDEFIKKEIN